jgi:hypothetical protein
MASKLAPEGSNLERVASVGVLRRLTRADAKLAIEVKRGYGILGAFLRVTDRCWVRGNEHGRPLEIGTGRGFVSEPVVAS